jgi:hypothetical protein
VACLWWNGNGFSLGFRGEFLAEKAKEENAFLVRCVYKLDEQQQIVRQFIELILEEILRHSDIESTKESLIKSRTILLHNIGSEDQTNGTA